MEPPTHTLQQNPSHGLEPHSHLTSRPATLGTTQASKNEELKLVVESSIHSIEIDVTVFIRASSSPPHAPACLPVSKLTVAIYDQMSNDPNVGNSPARVNKFDITNGFASTTKIIQLYCSNYFEIKAASSSKRK